MTNDTPSPTSEEIVQALTGGWSFTATRPAFDALLQGRIAQITDSDIDPSAQPLVAFEGLSIDDAGAFAQTTVRLPDGPRLVDQDADAGANALVQAVQKRHEAAEISSGQAERLQAGLRYMHRADPKTHGEICQNLLAVAFLSGISSSSFTIARLIGFVFLSDRADLDDEDIALLLIHEIAHTELNLITLFDDLFTPDSLNTEAFAPFQQKMRNPVGRIHAAHAVYRMLQFAQRDGSKHIDGLRDDLSATLKTFDDVDTTDVGRALISRLYPAVLNEGVPV